MQQAEALNLLKMGKNVFLTGAAGAGKTYILNKYIRYLKHNGVKVAVTASTGIAATHIQGTTIHAWSGIGVRDHVTQDDLDKLLKIPRIRSNYKKAHVLIIDEVSMLHTYQLDMVDAIARYMRNCDEAFGGLQLVLCGDFFQLPPVSRGPIADKKHFAFEAEAWVNGDMHVCYLEEQHRQSEDELLTVLNDIRSGMAGEHTRVPLRTRYKKEPEGNIKATKLYSRNINVDVINERELRKIEGQEEVFHMQTEGFDMLVEGLKKHCLAPEALILKVGAEVMFIKNDPLGRYVNGTRCVVIGFEESDEGWPIVRTSSNRTIVVPPEEWNYEDNGVIRATLIQVPLRLAWAITIHKSQGMTLDAAEIDLGDAFEPGMGYVALSRVRSLSGLKLMNLNQMALTVHPDILQQDTVFKNNSVDWVQYLKKLPKEEMAACHKTILEKRFCGGIIKVKNKAKKAPATPAHVKTLSFLKEKLSIEAMAEKRGVSAVTIINHLDKLKGEKKIGVSDIAHVKNMLAKKEFDKIYAELKKSKDGKLQPIYDTFDGEYSYTNIRFVRLFRS
ncbi:MAG: AAA family ATPase [Legionellaceae bacterium]|nr:AAA family ATPase [Legionellaceae bacterium]